MSTPTNFKQPVTIDDMITHGVARLRVTHADLTAAATSETLDWDDLMGTREDAVPANARIMWMWINVLELFSGGAVASCVVDVGDNGTVDELMSAVNIFTGAGTGLKAADGSYSFGTAIEADYNAKVKVTTTSANVAALTAGIMEVFILYQEIKTDAVTE